jgi:pimeloyl-ACP methyl ester carboxylesterase
MLEFTREPVLLPRAPAQPGVRMKWYRPPQQHVDTVVFVHGILGDYVKTWGRFPRLLTEDEDLPDLDILLWGYRTGLLARHNELRIEAAHLVTTLESVVRDTDDLILVGHSMGGLIILKGLIDRMTGGHAQVAPCRAIAWITLFASPLNGVWLAGILRKVFLLPLWLLRTLHKHLSDLSHGTFVEDLMRDVHRSIYQPLREDEKRRKIPIRIVAATRDGAIARSNRDLALAPYTDPAPHQLDENHRTIKLPTHLGDVRYRVLATDVQAALIRAFNRLCCLVIGPATTEEDRLVALDEMLRRYQKLIHLRIRGLRIPIHQQESAENELLLLIAAFGATRDLPPFIAVNRAMIVLKTRHKDWR